jgi:hypothetical protein
MSGAFELDAVGNQALREEAALNPIFPDQIRPGFFAGIPKSVGLAGLQAAGGVAKGLELAGAVPTGIVGALLAPQTDVPQKYFETIDPYVKGFNDAVTPSPNETGTAARVLGGFTQSAALLAAGAGNPTLLLASTGLGGAMDLTDQGVSPDVAALGGTLEAAGAAAGFKVPFLGKTLPMRVATGATGFAVTNAAATEAQRQLLLATGYSNLAAAYQPLNGTDRAIDFLVGGLFGAVHHYGAGGMAITADTRDAALALANARHAAIDTAPGFPEDVQTTAIHQATIEQAMGQLLRDEPVVPPADLAEANFAPKPPTMEPQDLPLALQQLDAERAPRLPEYGYTPNPDLLPEGQAIEEALGKQIMADPLAAEAAYAKLEDAKGGKVLNTDTARELSAHYLADRTQSEAVHEPASGLIKWMYPRRLAEAPKPGQLPLVLFTAGGTGAGKSTAIKGVLGDIEQKSQIVYDTNFDNAPKAIAKIDMALAAGKDALVAMVFADPVEALRVGALVRAAKQERKYKSGRTVPIESHLKTHFGSRSAIEQIVEHYANDPRVQFRFIDNSRGHGNQALVSLGELPKLPQSAYDSTREQALKTLRAEYDAGRISAAIYRGFAGHLPEVQQRLPDQAGSGGLRGEGGPGAAGESQAQRVGGNADQLGAWRESPGEQPGSSIYSSDLPGGHVGQIEALPIGYNGATLYFAKINGKDVGGQEYPTLEAAKAAIAEAAAGSAQLTPADRAFAAGTRATDATGVPQVLYRGSPKAAGSSLSGGLDNLIYLTEDKAYAGVYAGAAGHTASYVLRTTRPLEITTSDARPDSWKATLSRLGIEDPARFLKGLSPGDRIDFDTLLAHAGGKELIAEIRRQGYDSIRYRERNNEGDPLNWAWVAFGKDQVRQLGEKPAAAPTSTVFTSAGRQVQVAPKIVEASSLVTSDNPAFPQALQPRQRADRAALAAQVQTIATKLQPELLGESQLADTGAPITGPGGVVESGNGRVMALRHVYANLPEKAQAYRDFLTAQGHDISGFKEPVLVRERTQAMSDAERQAFATEANQASVAAMSPVERAQSDARLLDAAVMGQLHGEDLTTAKNAGFVKAVLGELPVGERNQLVDNRGVLSQEGERRLQAAILAKAYGGTPESNVTLGRLLESTSEEIRSPLGALQDAAPAFAKLRSMIADGKLGPEYDIAPAVLQAVEDVIKLKRQGSSLAEHLATQDMFSPTSLLSKAFYNAEGTKLLSREKAGAELVKYATQAMHERSSQLNVFSTGPMTPTDILRAAAAPPRTGDMFGLRTPQGGGEKVEPAVESAAQLAQSTPNLRVATGEVNPDGSAETISAQEAMQRAQQEIAQAEANAKAFDAAVNCAAQRGLQ